MPEFILAWCTGHQDYFQTMAGSVSERERLCAACAIRREEERNNRV